MSKNYLAPFEEDMKDISTINAVIAAYFEENADVDIIPVKRLMPQFIKAGVFLKDKKNGLPIRLVLRGLDEKDELTKVPSLHVVRKEEHSFWYFKREGHIPAALEVDNIPPKELTKRELKKLVVSEENYILDLCDKAMGAKGMRHHGFDFLLGDPHRSGRARTPIPCDLYYPDNKLVIEFNGHPHVPLNKNQIAQRELYAKRKRDTLAEHKIQTLEIPHELFDLTDQKHIKRDTAKDLMKVQELLATLKLGTSLSEEEE